MNAGFCSGAGKEIHFSRHLSGPMLNTKVWAEGRWGSERDNQKSEEKSLPCGYHWSTFVFVTTFPK